LISEKPILSIVTPNLNGGEYLEQTIKSVVNQDYSQIEYIIIDGGSSDDSEEIIKKYREFISHYEVRKDKNMYEAIHYGFRKSKGEILTWINSDDFYLQNCISKIIFKMKQKKYNWINCISSSMKDEKIHSYIPFFFPKDYIAQGRCHKSDYGFIPQESVFFSRDIYFKSGEIPTEYKYAGDFYLWKKMALNEKLHPIFCKCGVFRKRKNQLSENINEYYKELEKKYFYKKNFLRSFLSILYIFIFFYKL